MEERLRILQLIYSFDIEGTGGGISRFVYSLSKALDPAIFDVTICGLWNTGVKTENDHIRELNSLGIKAITAAKWNPQNPQKSFWNAFQGIKSLINRSPVDIVHSHSEFSDIVALGLKISPGVPAIVRTLHNGYKVEWRKRCFRRLLLTYFLYPLFFNCEIGVAQHVVRHLDQRWLAKILNKKGVVLHNAVDFQYFSSNGSKGDDAPHGLGINNDSFVIGTIGRLREEKGYDILLDSIKIVIKDMKIPVKLVIVGSGDLEKSLRQQTEDLNIDQDVIFTGPRRDIKSLLHDFDLFVSSSRWEGFSSAILEALSAGVPVLATNIPGNLEIIQDGVNGWLVPADNAQSLADGIGKLYRMTSEKRHTVVNLGRETAQEYSIENIAKQHQDLYLRIGNKNNRLLQD